MANSMVKLRGVSKPANVKFLFDLPSIPPTSPSPTSGPEDSTSEQLLAPGESIVSNSKIVFKQN